MNSTSNQQTPRVSVFGYFKSELTRGYLLERDQEKFTERRQRVYTFMKTPRELEKFLLYGYLHCMDAFLFIFTFLPLRIVVAFLKILTHPCGLLSSRTRHILEPAQACDILKGIILVVCCVIVNYIDTSMMYHLVRGQAVIKLYVFYNMLDMADRLFSSFGQDILEALFWTATEPKDRKREHVGVIPHLILAIIYVIIHTLLILFQATVLNVAFNSHNKALLTIMMSNNFVEIKSNMFKKIDKGFLYHIACSDVKERFVYVILLSVVFIRNMTEFSWNPDHIWVIIPDAVLVLVAELFVDWIKHAFIVKFNEIPADVYHSFSVRLAEDLVANRQNRAYIDYSDLLARRMGFTPLPLACLLVRICTRSFKISGSLGICILIALYLCLMTFKVLTSIIVLGKAYDLIKDKPNETETTKPSEKQCSTESSDVFADSSQILTQSSFVDSIGPDIEKQPKGNLNNSLKSNSSISQKSVTSNLSTENVTLSVDHLTSIQTVFIEEINISKSELFSQESVKDSYKNEEDDTVILEEKKDKNEETVHDIDKPVKTYDNPREDEVRQRKMTVENKDLRPEYL
ncbi:TAPT1 [Mytilus coruscus]|uniref:TAPT1 n=1 Tax=Mytilus coruscus TaxID=42192 RepID=A0A6J8AZ72_MYTCO|nr:TAPT1 [Mytilus coruscus]